MTPYKDLIGTIVIPILGAVPEGFMVLFSGLGPDPQATAGIGIGTLAGSSIMLLTINWAMVIVAGRVDIDNEKGNYIVEHADEGVNGVENENGNNIYNDNENGKLTRHFDVVNTGCENNESIKDMS